MSDEMIENTRFYSPLDTRTEQELEALAEKDLQFYDQLIKDGKELDQKNIDELKNSESRKLQ